DSGMLLFPGESAVYKLLNPEWIKIDKTDLSYTHNGKRYNVEIAMCSGACDRYQRPLACRIFPLTPYLNADGKLEIITDPRARGICPLAKHLYLEDFDADFVRNVEKAFKLLLKSGHFIDFMRVYSDYLDDFGRFFTKKERDLT
ncbi:MAG: hypothetical protein LIO59_05780, partial [Oscillospiraceae bacterium]|nr:hypothetical protein [Oscillospiraceae bacterium]